MRRFLLIVFILFISSNLFAEETQWKNIAKGIDYTKIGIGQGRIHAFRINPDNYDFGIVQASDSGSQRAYVKDMAKKKGALIAINGGFFTPDDKPLGLLIHKGKKLNPIKNTSWWSVFYIKKNIPYIVHTNSFKFDQKISMAVQSGPRLVVNGSIPKLKASRDERSAVCYDTKKNVIIIATENLMIKPAEFASYLKKTQKQGGLNCKTALNLDGGSSTQLYAHLKNFKLDVSGFSRVTNAVAVFPK